MHNYYPLAPDPASCAIVWGMSVSPPSVTIKVNFGKTQGGVVANPHGQKSRIRLHLGVLSNSTVPLWSAPIPNQPHCHARLYLQMADLVEPGPESTAPSGAVSSTFAEAGMQGRASRREYGQRFRPGKPAVIAAKSMPPIDRGESGWGFQPPARNGRSGSCVAAAIGGCAVAPQERSGAATLIKAKGTYSTKRQPQ